MVGFLLLLLNSPLPLGEMEGVEPLMAGSTIAVQTGVLDMYSHISHGWKYAGS